MRTDDYDKTIDYLFNQLPMYQRQGTKAIKKDLTNIRALLSILDDPHLDYRCIHIAGTNGKGTVAHLMTSLLIKSGYKVGLYTSPHYVDFRERIKIDGQWISKSDVVQFVTEHRKMIEEVRPSFFEITVAMAFTHFSETQVDIAVIETGLGGRLDSTNIINPILSAITNISLDHTQYLGHDLYTIAREKAGIIKPETPVVIGRFQVACDHVFLETARHKNASITFASNEWLSKQAEEKVTFYRKQSEFSITLEIPEAGPFIFENVVTVLEMAFQCQELNLLSIPNEAITKGIFSFRQTSGYIGRWQVLSKDPYIIADSAHNLQALDEVLNHISQGGFKRIHYVIGFVKEKDLDPILKLFHPDDFYYFTCPEIFRGLPADELQIMAGKYDLHGDVYVPVKEALEAAIKNYQSGDLIYIGGSSFVVGDVLADIQESK